jgi:hypothetical protein
MSNIYSRYLMMFFYTYIFTVIFYHIKSAFSIDFDDGNKIENFLLFIDNAISMLKTQTIMFIFHIFFYYALFIK